MRYFGSSLLISTVYSFVAFRFAKNLIFHYVLLVSFYLDLGLSLSQIGLIESAYWLAKLSADFPAGAMADRYGQRVMLYFGTLLLSIGFAILGAATSWVTIVIAQAFIATGHSATANSDSAACLSAVRSAGSSVAFETIEAAGMGARYMGLFVSIAVGALAADAIGVRGLLFATSLATLSALVFIHRLAPVRNHLPSTKGNAAATNLQCPRFFPISTKFISGIALFSLFFFFDMTSINIFQITLREVGLSTKHATIAFSIVILITGAISALLTRVVLPFNQWLVVLIASAVIHFAALGQLSESKSWSITELAIVYGPLVVMKAVYYPVLRTEILRTVRPDQLSRALSIAAIASGTLLMICTPISMNTIDHFGLRILSAALLFLTLAVGGVFFIISQCTNHKQER